MTSPILATSGLTKRFGGLVANQDVNITLYLGSVHAVLGPNGAGKSTLINLLAGDTVPSAGSIYFKGRDISSYRADRRSRLGIGRSFQRTNIFRDFSVYENCRLSAQAKRPAFWKMLTRADHDIKTQQAAIRAMEMAGLANLHHMHAAQLNHGAQRQLEVAMVLAAGATVLLLDEPLAGMGAEESKKMVDMIRHISCNHAILLIEHDMDSVFAVADTVTVMVNGKVLESGPPQAIKASAEVQRAYLGETDAFVL